MIISLRRQLQSLKYCSLSINQNQTVVPFSWTVQLSKTRCGVLIRVDSTENNVEKHKYPVQRAAPIMSGENTRLPFRPTLVMNTVPAHEVVSMLVF